MPPLTDDKRWIVLVNNLPLGPLTEIQVQELLSQGKITVRDTAVLVGSGSKSPQTDWKFLWQFLEFDRREWGKEPIIPPTSERREPVNSDNLKIRALCTVPPDFQNTADIIEKAEPCTEPFLFIPTDIEGNIEKDLERIDPRLAKESPLWKIIAVGTVMILMLILATRSLRSRQPERQLGSEPTSEKR